jgi:hypothetical protein
MRDGGRVAEKILKAHEFEFSAWAESLELQVSKIGISTPRTKTCPRGPQTWGTQREKILSTTLDIVESEM